MSFKAPKATTTEPGVITLAGDLGGTATSPSVLKINGASVPAAGSLTTGNVLQVNGSSSLTYGAVNLAGGANFVTGNLPVGNVAPGTSAQVLMSNATPATTWTTIGGDVSLSATGSVTINQIAGTSPVKITTASTLEWSKTVSSPTLTQETATSGNGQQLLVQAQGSSAATSTGGNLILASGAGTSADGYVSIEAGGTQAFTVTGVGGLQANLLGTGVIHSDSSGNLTSSLIVNADIAAAGTANIAVNKLAAGTSAQVLMNNATPTPTWTTFGGDVSLSATGSVTVNQIAGTSPVKITTASTLEWSKTVSSPTFTQETATSGNGAQLLIQAQGSTAATSTGGNLILASGAGTSADGYVSIEAGLSPAITVSGTRSIQFNSYGTGVIHSDSSGNLTSSLIVDADVSSSAAIAVSKLSNGSAGQFLVENSGATSPAWTTISGDISASASTVGQLSVVSLTGSASNVNFPSGSAVGNNEVITFNVTSSGSGKVKTVDTTGADSAALTITTGTTTTSGNSGALNLTTGAAAGTVGTVNVQTGGTTQISISPTTITLGGTGNTSTVLRVGTTTNLTLTSANLQWAQGITTPSINQAAATGAGTSFTLQAQNAGGSNNTGGNLILSGGTKTGTGFDGYVFLEAGGNIEAFVNSSLPNFSDGGLGIGATPGTSPTISSGSGAPSSTQPNGSIYLRTDGGSSTTIYEREAGTWVAIASSGGASSLTAPVTSTVNTNSTHATYTIDSTGGSSDYTILNANTLTALSVTFSVTNGSSIVTSSASTTISGGTCIVFGSDAVAYVFATTGTSTTTFTLTTAYQGSTASNVVASTFSYYAANYVLPSPTAGRILQIKDTTGFLETNPINLLPNSTESIEKRNPLLTVNTPITVINGTNFVVANPMLQPLPVITFNLTNDSTGTTTGNIYVSSTPSLNSCPQALSSTTVVNTSGTAVTATTNGTTTVTMNGSTTFIAGQLIQFSNQVGTFYSVASTLAAGTSLTLTTSATNTNASGLTVVRVGEALSGTFNLTNNQAANTNIATTISQVNALFVGSPVVFGTQPNTTYFVSSVTGGGSPAIQLTTQYTGATNASAVAAQPSGILYPGSKMAFSTQLNATYGVATIFTPGGTGDGNYYNNGARTWTTTNGSASLTASTATSATAGDVIQFSNQVGSFYVISASTSASTSATLTTNFTGTGASGLYAYKYASGLTGTFNLNGQAANTNISTNGTDQTGTLVVGSAIIFGTQPNTTYIISSVTSTNIQLTTNYTGATNASAVAGSPINIGSQTTGIKLMEKYGGGGNATTTAGNTLVSVVFTCTNGSTSVTSLSNGTGFNTTNILFPGSKLLFYSYNSGASTLTIQSGTGASTSSCSYTISSISGSTITLTASFGGTSTAAINYQSTTTNFQSLGGTFSITNGSTLVTATQSQTGFIDVGSQIYFINSGSLNTSEGSVQTIAGMSPDGKTLQLSATYAGTTRAAATAVADLTALSIGGVGMPFGGVLGSILFGSDTTYYPMVDILPGQSLLSNSTAVTTATGDFSVTNGSATVTAVISQTNIISGGGGNIITFGNQPYVTYSVASLAANGTTITLSSNFTGTTSTNVSASVVGPNATVSLTNNSANSNLGITTPVAVTGTPFVCPLTQSNTVFIYSTIGNNGANTITTTYTGANGSSPAIFLSTAPILQLSTNYTGSTATVTSAKLTNYPYTTNNGILQLTYDSTSSSWYVTN